MSRTPMKLILTQEVSGLGTPGDVVDVAAGYGRNYLIPRGFAIHWTRGAEKQVDLIKRARSVREIRTLEDAQAVAGQLQRLKVRIKVRAGENGRLFGSVGPADIAAAVKSAGRPAGGLDPGRARVCRVPMSPRLSDISLNSQARNEPAWPAGFPGAV